MLIAATRRNFQSSNPRNQLDLRFNDISKKPIYLPLIAEVLSSVSWLNG